MSLMDEDDFRDHVIAGDLDKDGFQPLDPNKDPSDIDDDVEIPLDDADLAMLEDDEEFDDFDEDEEDE